MATSYVKFQRGSQAAYDKLVTNNRVDENTLYFIYPEGNGTVGKLYLGARLISGGDVVLSAATLNDLADVIVKEAKVHDFLVAEKVTTAEGKEITAWVNKSLNDVATLIKEAMGEIAAPAKIFQIERTAAHANDMDAIAEVVGEETVLTTGDMAIVKMLIATGKYQYTAYVHTGAEWAAMDGNYNADNVYFDQDLITSFAMGNIKLSNGMATIPAMGKNLSEVWESIYVKEINTDLKGTAPSCSMSGNSTKYYLVGATSETQTITLGLNKGSYDYGYGYVESKDETDPAAGTAAKVRVTNDGTGVVTVATTPYALTWDGTTVSPTATNGNVFTCNGIKKTTAPVQAQVSGTVKYENAGNPVSNLGNIYPAQAYANATSGANTQTLARWYYPFYQGFTVDSDAIADPANITCAQLEALNKSNMATYRFSDDAATVKDQDRPGTTKFVDANAYSKKKVNTATANGSWRQYFLAYPKTYSYSMSGAKDGNNIDCTVSAAEDVTFTFNGVDVVYSVYYINNAAAYDTLKISWNI